jgi:hypothetical protein
MNVSSITRKNLGKQQATDRESVLAESARDSFVRELVEEYSFSNLSRNSVFVNDLRLEDKKILLSHIVDAGEYEWLMETPNRLEEGIKENKCYMQELLDEVADEIYWKHMEEEGISIYHHKDNNETFCRKI